MKRYLTTLLFALFSTLAFSQYQSDEAETARPMRDTEIERFVSVMDIEGVMYEDVKITIKSISADYFIYNKDRVKVTIKDKDGKKIWKKTLHNAYMYVFKGGQVQIGKPNFDQIVIFKSQFGNYYTGIIREKEGVY